MPLEVTGDYNQLRLHWEAMHKTTNTSKRLRTDRRAFFKHVHSAWWWSSCQANPSIAACVALLVVLSGGGDWRGFNENDMRIT